MRNQGFKSFAASVPPVNADGVFTGATLNTSAYAQIQKQLQTTQAQDFAEDSLANSQQPSVGGNASATCATGNTLPGTAAGYGVFVVGTPLFETLLIAKNSVANGMPTAGSTEG